MITPGDSTFYCTDCGSEISLQAYRQKVPRCDDCLVDELTRDLDGQIASLVGTMCRERND